MAVRQLSLKSIRTDGDTQPRAALNMVTISEYREALHEGATFPPVTVFFDGDDHWLADGFHRHGAYEREGFEEIPADVREGTREDAQWFAYGANQTHGLRRSNDDKARAVTAALLHPKGARMSAREIADHVGVSHTYVNNLRQELAPSVNDLQIAEREVTRGGQTYTQNTANIGKSPRPSVSTFAPEPDEPTDVDDWDRDTPDGAFAQADFYELPATEPAPARPAAIVSIDRSEQEDPGEMLSAVLDRNPDVRDRLDTAVLSANFARAIRLIRDHLLCLNPEMLGEMETEQSGYATRAFILDTRRWLDRLEASMQGGLRAVK